MRTHLLRVEAGFEVFAPLVAAARDAAVRIGWLELGAPEPLPPGLVVAAAGGALRAVAIGDGWSAAVKRLRGGPVLGDLVGEHFRGCSLVLVRGETSGEAGAGSAAALPLLAADGDAWRITPPGAAPRRYAGADDLVAALRRPRPFAA